MMAELSNFINYQLVNVQKLVERITKTNESSLSLVCIGHIDGSILGIIEIFDAYNMHIICSILRIFYRYPIGLSHFFILCLEQRSLYLYQSLFLSLLKDGAF